MKKLHSLFILSILALTMFVGCQNPTDGTGNGVEAVDSTPTETPAGTPTDTTPTVDADEATYGFVKTVNYTVEANGQSLPGTKTGAELIALAKEKKMVKDTDYTIDGTTVSLTASGVGKYLGYSLSVNASDEYNVTGGGMKEAGKTVTLSITHYDGTDYKTPTGLYLVKVHIKEGETELNIEDVKVENHKITFTMPDKNINVFASFEDIKSGSGNLMVGTDTDNEVVAVLCFNNKAYDNLKEVPLDGEGYYVLNVGVLIKGKSMCFNETKYGNEYTLSKDGTLNDNQYTFGVLDGNGKLTILKLCNNYFFTYEGLKSN